MAIRVWGYVKAKVRYGCRCPRWWFSGSKYLRRGGGKYPSFVSAISVVSDDSLGHRSNSNITPESSPIRVSSRDAPPPGSFSRPCVGRGPVRVQLFTAWAPNVFFSTLARFNRYPGHKMQPGVIVVAWSVCVFVCMFLAATLVGWIGGDSVYRKKEAANRTYFFNNYIVFFLVNLHLPSKSNTNSTQILGFILICLSFTTSHFHTCTLQRM